MYMEMESQTWKKINTPGPSGQNEQQATTHMGGWGVGQGGL